MSAPHALAPWSVKRLDQHHVMINDAEGMIVVPRMIAERGATTGANAALVAAAPELLAELREVTAALIATRPQCGCDTALGSPELSGRHAEHCALAKILRANSIITKATTP